MNGLLTQLNGGSVPTLDIQNVYHPVHYKKCNGSTAGSA